MQQNVNNTLQKRYFIAKYGALDNDDDFFIFIIFIMVQDGDFVSIQVAGALGSFINKKTLEKEMRVVYNNIK